MGHGVHSGNIELHMTARKRESGCVLVFKNKSKTEHSGLKTHFSKVLTLQRSCRKMLKKQDVETKILNGADCIFFKSIT